MKYKQLTIDEKTELHMLIEMMEENLSYLKRRQWPTFGEVETSGKAWKTLTKQLVDKSIEKDSAIKDRVEEDGMLSEQGGLR